MNEEKKTEVSELYSILSKNFPLIVNDSIINTGDIKDIDEMKKFLSAKIKRMIENNFNQLTSILYRIDIEERKVQEIFYQKEKNKIPDLLSELIIQRQLQKISSRKIHKDGNF